MGFLGHNSGDEEEELKATPAAAAPLALRSGVFRLSGRDCDRLGAWSPAGAVRAALPGRGVLTAEVGRAKKRAESRVSEGCRSGAALLW